MQFLFGAVFLGLSPLFWLIAIGGFLIITAYADAEKFSRSLGILFLVAMGLIILSGLGFNGAYHAVVDHPMLALTYLGYYIAIGVLYGVLRWAMKIHKVRRKLIRFRDHEKISGKMTKDQRDLFLETIGERYSQQIPLRVRDNKARITYWMMFWPLSLPISLRPITRLFSYLYDQIAGLLQSMSNRAFRDLA